MPLHNDLVSIKITTRITSCPCLFIQVVSIFLIKKCSFCVYRSQVILHFRLKGRLGIMPILQVANFGILSDRNNVSFS